MLRIDNLLGRIIIRGGARPGEIHIVAEKRASTPEALGRLRVHYTAFESGEVVVDTRVELGGRERSLPLARQRRRSRGGGAARARGRGQDLRRRRLGVGAARRRAAGDDRRPDRRLATCAAAWSRASCAAARRSPRSKATSTSTASRGTWTCATWAAGASTRGWSTAASAPRSLRSGLVRLVTTTGQIVLIGVDPPGRPLRPAQLCGRCARHPGGRFRPVRAARPLGHAGRVPTSRCAPRAGDGDWLRAEYVGRRAPVRARAPRCSSFRPCSAQVNIQIQPRSPAVRELRRSSVTLTPKASVTVRCDRPRRRCYS